MFVKSLSIVQSSDSFKFCIALLWRCFNSDLWSRSLNCWPCDRHHCLNFCQISTQQLVVFWRMLETFIPFSGLQALQLLCTFCFKLWPIPASFSFIFVLFTSQINYKLKKHRWSAWESNPGPQDGRHRQNHGAMAATHF